MKPITVVVPVLRRPHRAAPFMESLRRCADLVETVAVVADEDDVDTLRAWEWVADTAAHAGLGPPVEVYTTVHKPGTFAVKANQIVDAIETDWMFLVGDDVAFHDDWAENALATAGPETRVIGTNDLGTPAVKAGEHATHMLLHLGYVRLRGASWDGPGTVAHAGYHHWFVDNEIVAKARQEHAWASATDSIVEHLHPYFERGEMDDTYRLGESQARADGERWLRRLQQFAPELMP